MKITKMIKLFLPMALIALLFCGCGSPSQRSGTQQGNEDSVPANRAYNFLTVYHTTAGDTVYADSTILKLQPDEQGRVSGTYLWVLPGKDGKYGKITGRLSNDTVYGRYAYSQEGASYNDSIRVVLQPGRAIVTQFNAPGYRLTDTLAAWP